MTLAKRVNVTCGFRAFTWYLDFHPSRLSTPLFAPKPFSATKRFRKLRFGKLVPPFHETRLTTVQLSLLYVKACLLAKRRKGEGKGKRGRCNNRYLVTYTRYPYINIVYARFAYCCRTVTTRSYSRGYKIKGSLCRKNKRVKMQMKSNKQVIRKCIWIIISTPRDGDDTFARLADSLLP